MKGFVKKIATKEGVSSRGKWVRYSFRTDDEFGNEADDWVTFGFEAPPFKEGDYIEFQVEENERGFKNYVKGSGRVVANPPVRQGARQPAAVASAKRPAGDALSIVDQLLARQLGADRQQQIVLQHSQEMAVRIVGALLAHEGLPMSAAKTKAGEAKRFDEIVAAVDKFTVKFFNDVATGRLLSSVADMGVVSSLPDSVLPPAGEPAAAEDY